MTDYLTYRQAFERKTGLKAPIRMSVSAIFQNPEVCQCYTCHEKCTLCWDKGEKNPVLSHDYKERMIKYRNEVLAYDFFGGICGASQQNCYGEHHSGGEVALLPAEHSN